MTNYSFKCLATSSIFHSTLNQQSVSCDFRFGLTHHQSKAMFSSLSADGGKKWISGGREKERMRGSVSLPRSIGESKPLLMFHSSLSLFYVFTFFFLYQVFLHLTLPESQKMLTNSRLGNSSIFICTRSKKKKKKNLQPLASLTPPSETHRLSHTLAKLGSTFSVADPELRDLPATTFLSLFSSSNFLCPTSLTLFLLHFELTAVLFVSCFVTD